MAVGSHAAYSAHVNRDSALFPEGDFRNWAEVEAWANTIAEALKAQLGEAENL
jgi:hypothetical protein